MEMNNWQLIFFCLFVIGIFLQEEVMGGHHMWHELSFYFQLPLSPAKRFVISVGILLILLLSENTGEQRSLQLIFLSLYIFLQSFMETILQKWLFKKSRKLKKGAYFFLIFQIQYLYTNALCESNSYPRKLNFQYYHTHYSLMDIL